MSARIHIDSPLALGAERPLPVNASRHVQVLRLQPGAPLMLFDGLGGEWSAEVQDMGRKVVTVRVLAHHPVERELATPVTLALGMPANERMDWLVEKATELGVVCIQPLVCERSVLRLAGERADRKAAHWQGIAVAACEQSGRNRVPVIAAPLALREWLAALAATGPGAGTGTGAFGHRLLLSLAPGARSLAAVISRAGALPLTPNDSGQILLSDKPAGVPLTVLSGPEGGLSPAEMAAATACGFLPVTLGARVLRADTAPLAVLAFVAALETSP